MKIRNDYSAPLGFGTARILPGETIDADDLPQGYGMNNPVTKSYLSRGWFTQVGKSDGKDKAANSINVNTALNTGGAGVQKMRLDPEQFDGWETEQIFKLAADMGIELGDAPERGDIIAKIAAEEVEVGEYSNLNPEDYNADSGAGGNTGNGAGSEVTSELAKKNVDRLSLDELKTLAAEMKLEVVEADTRKTLIEKIKAARTATE